ncbi:ABC transporter substrate-binding protein [Mangrovitalea sediminis]|uniref:ABC transporter substrate-binding protein n=1 Tax=Mangrovitalea sediminis TaxID=1982043 RepID=UPI0018E98948|nr:ABC transporter substrate-binding protein [Mangrovitalea sediminis]
MNKNKMLSSLALATSLMVAAGTASAAKFSDNEIKIGVLGDMSGVYSTGFSGKGAVDAVQMAVDDFGGKIDGKPIKVISGDHRNKADIASATARQWIDQDHVDMIADLTNSAVGLAVQHLANEKKVITINTGSASSDLTGKACTKYGIHYGYDTYALPHGTASAIVKNGGKKWYFITADYTFGHSLEANTAAVVKQHGGEILGQSLAPLGTNDFSSYLLQAKASGAQIIGLANAGNDTINAIQQAHEFNLTDSGVQLAGLLVLLSDVQGLGLQTAQGLLFTTAWYWDHDAASREWAERYMKKYDQAPTFPHAALYSATMTYLKAVKAAGTDNPDKVRAEMGKMKIDDFFAQGGHIRPDGLLVHKMFLVQAKKPGQAKGKWDLLNVVREIPANEAYPPISESVCPLDKM